MNSELLRDILYVSLLVCAILTAGLISLQIALARLKQKNYFLNRDRERYAETLYASKDGYFAFIYPDERIRDPRRGIRERCSRRLAVMLNLKNGVLSSFDDVLAVFYKNDAQKISKYLNLLKQDGIGFEDLFSLKGNARIINVSGARINGQDGNLYCDMLWFRDQSEASRQTMLLQAENEKLTEKMHLLEKVLDTLTCPIWLRNESLDIVAANRAYQDLSGLAVAKDEKNKDNTSALLDIIGQTAALEAVQTNKSSSGSLNLVNNGQALAFQVTETPCRFKDGLEKNGTVGILEDMSELVDIKRNFQINQTAHLEVLSALGTAFAIFNTDRTLMFYNRAFLNLWSLTSAFLDSTPSYGAVLDQIRALRLLPEVSDYRKWRAEEEKMFNAVITPKETLMHIPDGRTFKRMVAPYPNGLIFAYEDVSDRLAATRMINQMASVQQNILDQMRDAVIMFDTDQHLQHCNKNYQKLWHLSEAQTQNQPSLEEILEGQKPYLTIAAPWPDVKKSMMRHILTLHSHFMLECRDKSVLEVIPVILSDDSLMIMYVKV